MKRVVCLVVLTCMLTALTACFVPNASPVAVFSWAISGLRVDFDAGPSHDADGTIELCRWNFGDGSTGTGETASHTYATDVARSYSVRLIVTDDDGATDTVTNTISVEPPGGSGPDPEPDPDSDIVVTITASEMEIDILSYEIEEGSLWHMLTILAKNVSGQTFDWVSMSARMKDSGGTVVESGYDLQSDVTPGMTFELDMFIFEQDRVRSIEIYEIETFVW